MWALTKKVRILHYMSAIFSKGQALVCTYGSKIATVIVAIRAAIIGMTILG